MSLETKLLAFAQGVGADIKALYASVAGFASQGYVDTSVAALRTELRAGAGAALDTFAEVAAQLGADETAAAALSTAVGNRVRYDAAQTLTTPQKAQACANLGVGDPEQDLLAAYNTAKA